jgi:hypothetical protein
MQLPPIYWKQKIFRDATSSLPYVEFPKVKGTCEELCMEERYQQCTTLHRQKKRHDNNAVGYPGAAKDWPLIYIRYASH